MYICILSNVCNSADDEGYEENGRFVDFESFLAIKFMWLNHTSGQTVKNLKIFSGTKDLILLMSIAVGMSD